MMVKEYVERSGDTAFGFQMYPVIVRSIDGTITYHCDSLGFLTHGDAETWMDAVGPDGPWSPRGNRANDIQALWAQQLEAGIWFATRVGDTKSAQRWNQTLRRLQTNFQTYFVTERGVVDHLKIDGSADTQLRPNQIFTTPLLSDEVRAKVLATVTRNLTYEHGVASLWQDDENFHPYHQYNPYYPKDAAYHNGIVWTWLQGPLISELRSFGRSELAFRLTTNSVHQILDRGAVGTQSELLDAAPRPGETEPRLSGTFSQAWNLAEFVRNFYDDYLGVRISLLEHSLVLRPNIPKAMGKVKATINLNGRGLPIEIEQHSSLKTVVLDGSNLRAGGKGKIQLMSDTDRLVGVDFKIPPRAVIRLELRDTSVTLLADGIKHDFSSVIDNPRLSVENLSFASPLVRSGLRSLRGPSYPTITHAQTKAKNAHAKLIVNTGDAAGDDVGTGAYTYPKNPNFAPGSFDITNFTVSYDDTNAYFGLRFKSLSNPGWHPEYGFQLTFVAVAIDTDGIPGRGKRLVERNANYLLDDQHAYERLILVGGGVRLEDDHRKVLAEYIPAETDVTNPLGDAESATISFAIPVAYLGKPAPTWTFIVLSGGQDDHGGAGLGEFRNVDREASEWSGGGKTRTEEANVYDVLMVGPE
ncbi:MAG: hypothetical protein HY708_04375 [Ignavibacteriae bacterium]|nr:hypothetical protein [Ignavibacteriota bacterium]